MKEEIQCLFNHFDKDKKGIISYHNFVSSLNREHLDLIKISKRILHYLEVFV